MKKITIILVGLIWIGYSVSAYAQETIIPLEDQNTVSAPENQVIYYKDVNNLLNKYTGTWKYEDSSHLLQIQITKEEHASKGFGSYNDSNFEDYISIRIFYKFNGVTKYTYQMGTMWGNRIISTNKINLIYEEPSSSTCGRKERADLLLEFIQSGLSSQLKWKRIKRLPYSGDCDYDLSNFSIPAELTLVKQ